MDQEKEPRRSLLAGIFLNRYLVTNRSGFQFPHRSSLLVDHMSPDHPKSEWCREYDLVAERPLAAEREPAEHQTEALGKLGRWYGREDAYPNGGVLVLPTGGGKTFTAVHFLCTRPLSDELNGYKVLWLAHTHHLLEQATHTFNGLVRLIHEPRRRLNLRVVSGTPGHFPVHTIRPTDDVLVATLQTICNAIRVGHAQLDAFLKSAGERLFVVFDEAHHSPAPSYRRLLVGLRERHPRMRLLGLTATPTHTVERQRGWFTRLFPQGVIHEVTAEALIASGILAQPIFEEMSTEFTPAFNDAQYQDWVRTNRDLPEDIITLLSDNQTRNERIASHYAGNRAKYGRTIMFADRWPQCVALREMLIARGVRAGAIFTQRGGSPGTAEARNRQTEDQNRAVLRQFRDGDLDVLINIRMLTEGTDIPDAQTVFLTRQTTSQILLTQMVGRALRGPRFGGTERAYVVSFIDDWRQRINWAGFGQFLAGPADESVTPYARRPPVQLISIELVRRLARQMDSGVNINPGPYRSFLPAGWYHVRFEAVVLGTEDVEPVNRLVMVFESEVEAFGRLVDRLRRLNLDEFEGEGLTFDLVRDQIAALEQEFFGENDARIGDRSVDVLAVARHMAQNDGSPPEFFPFDARNQHDLDTIAQRHLDARLDRWAEDDALRAEFSRSDRFWGVMYRTYDRFKSQYDGCTNRLVHARRHGADAATHRPAVRLPEAIPDREPTEEVRRAVFERDGRKCLCCGLPGQFRHLRVDHIAPYYHGGLSERDNLQMLCVACNMAKGIERISFRTNSSTLTEAPGRLPAMTLPARFDVRDMDDWQRLVRRVVHLFYRCAAVESVTLAARRERFRGWTIRLFSGNDPSWLIPFIPEFITFIRDAREDAGLQAAPDTIEVT